MSHFEERMRNEHEQKLQTAQEKEAGKQRLTNLINLINLRKQHDAARLTK